MFLYHHFKHVVHVVVLLCLLLFGQTLQAQTPIAHSDSVRISLLTCSAGEEIYALFGHTAIRYEDQAQGIDIVFNYGLFSFDTPNFILRFVKGETDYILGVVDFKRFEAEYAYDNRTVWQQTLNLTSEEKETLFQLLRTNCLPENRTYRYNYFFDNCSTRPRDKIEESIDGNVIYQATDYRQSFRDIIYQYTKSQLWSRFGMDLCLGVKADRLITFREEMFIPFYLMDAFANATIVNNENIERPLVIRTSEIVTASDVEDATVCWLTPLRSSLLLFVLISLCTIYGLRKKKSLWGIDLFLFASAGAVGCVIAFLSLFSVHPAVHPNYLIFVFHPLHLLLLPFFLRKEAKHKRSYYHLINTVVILLFILIWPVNPQHFNLAVLPLALSLLIRSACHLILTYKKSDK